MKQKMKNLLKKLYLKNHLSHEDLLYILDNINYKSSEILCSYAQRTVEKTYHNKIYLRALLEFSNYCKNKCRYCGINNNNKKVSRFRLTAEEILESCKAAYEQGYRTFVLQSGEDDFYKRRLINIIENIKFKFSNAAITLSIGEYSYQYYKKLYEAGADRFLLRHETISKNLYNNLHPNMNYENRFNCLKKLKKIGYQVGAGFIVGLPGQTNRILASDLIFLKRFNPDMIGIGPLIPHPETPLAECNTGSVKKTTILLALLRLLLPKTLLPVTTAVNTLDKKGWEKGIKAGANVIMPVVSPASVRDNYEIYQNKKNTDVFLLDIIKDRVEKIGYKVDMGRGDSLNYIRKSR